MVRGVWFFHDCPVHLQGMRPGNQWRVPDNKKIIYRICVCNSGQRKTNTFFSQPTDIKTFWCTLEHLKYFFTTAHYFDAYFDFLRNKIEIVACASPSFAKVRDGLLFAVVVVRFLMSLTEFMSVQGINLNIC